MAHLGADEALSTNLWESVHVLMWSCYVMIRDFSNLCIYNFVGGELEEQLCKLGAICAEDFDIIANVSIYVFDCGCIVSAGVSLWGSAV